MDPIREDGVDQQESEEEEALNPQIQPFNKLPKEQMVIDFTDEQGATMKERKMKKF